MSERQFDLLGDLPNIHAGTRGFSGMILKTVLLISVDLLFFFQGQTTPPSCIQGYYMVSHVSTAIFPLHTFEFCSIAFSDGIHSVLAYI